MTSTLLGVRTATQPPVGLGPVVTWLPESQVMDMFRCMDHPVVFAAYQYIKKVLGVLDCTLLPTESHLRDVLSLHFMKFMSRAMGKNVDAALRFMLCLGFVPFVVLERGGKRRARVRGTAGSRAPEDLRAGAGAGADTEEDVKVVAGVDDEADADGSSGASEDEGEEDTGAGAPRSRKERVAGVTLTVPQVVILSHTMYQFGVMVPGDGRGHRLVARPKNWATMSISGPPDPALRMVRLGVNEGILEKARFHVVSMPDPGVVSPVAAALRIIMQQQNAERCHIMAVSSMAAPIVPVTPVPQEGPVTGASMFATATRVTAAVQGAYASLKLTEGMSRADTGNPMSRLSRVLEAQGNAQLVDTLPGGIQAAQGEPAPQTMHHRIVVVPPGTRMEPGPQSTVDPGFTAQNLQWDQLIAGAMGVPLVAFVPDVARVGTWDAIKAAVESTKVYYQDHLVAFMQDVWDLTNGLALAKGLLATRSKLAQLLDADLAATTGGPGVLDWGVKRAATHGRARVRHHPGMSTQEAFAPTGHTDLLGLVEDGDRGGGPDPTPKPRARPRRVVQAAAAEEEEEEDPEAASATPEASLLSAETLDTIHSLYVLNRMTVKFVFSNFNRLEVAQQLFDRRQLSWEELASVLVSAENLNPEAVPKQDPVVAKARLEMQLQEERLRMEAEVRLHEADRLEAIKMKYAKKAAALEAGATAGAGGPGPTRSRSGLGAATAGGGSGATAPPDTDASQRHDGGGAGKDSDSDDSSEEDSKAKGAALGDQATPPSPGKARLARKKPNMEEPLTNPGPTKKHRV